MIDPKLYAGGMCGQPEVLRKADGSYGGIKYTPGMDAWLEARSKRFQDMTGRKGGPMSYGGMKK